MHQRVGSWFLVHACIFVGRILHSLHFPSPPKNDRVQELKNLMFSGKPVLKHYSKRLLPNTKYTKTRQELLLPKLQVFEYGILRPFVNV